jgi:hypothetical protein
MNTQHQNHDWKDRLRAELGSASEPDFEAWLEQHPDAIDALASTVSPAQAAVSKASFSRSAVARSFKWIVAGAALVAGLVWLTSSSGNMDPSVFAADDIPGVDGVQTMTWTTTSFVRWTSEDGKRTWIQEQRMLHAFRYPGQYRETLLDQEGKPLSVHITDYRAGRTLALHLKERKASLKFPVDERDPRGPFARVGDAFRDRNFGKHNELKSISLQGQREIDEIQANVVRVVTRGVGESTDLYMDFMFDVDSKRLVGMFATKPPQGFALDSPERNNPAEEKWSRFGAAGSLNHEMVINPKIDPGDFSLDPPRDFAFEKIAKPTVTEEEMIAYLAAAARFNGNQFPDSPYGVYDREKLNAAWAKNESARTQVEQALIDNVNKIRFREIYQPPIKRFEEDQTTPGSFHYVGSGVSVGQADRIVAWYKLRAGAKHRAVYGDLSVKEVTEADLPLQLPH